MVIGIRLDSYTSIKNYIDTIPFGTAITVVSILL